MLCQYQWLPVGTGSIAARRKWDKAGCSISGNGAKGGSCLRTTGVQAEGDGIVRRDEEDARKLAAGIQIAVSGTDAVVGPTPCTGLRITSSGTAVLAACSADATSQHALKRRATCHALRATRATTALTTCNRTCGVA